LQWALLLAVVRLARRSLGLRRGRSRRAASVGPPSELERAGGGAAPSPPRVPGTAILSSPELLAIFAVWVVANMAAGRGLIHPLLCSLAGPAYYARSGATLRAVQHHVPAWLAIRDLAAAARFYEGYGAPVPWRVWLAPLGTWALFFVPFLVANVSLAALFEPLWVRREQLAFPLAALPVTVLGQGEREQPAGFGRMVRVGIAVPVLLHALGAAHAYMPAIPSLPFYNDVSYLAATPPWTALKPLYLNLYPLLIGITFLAPLDVTFSILFFLCLNKVELLVAAAAGWSDGATGGTASAPPYVEEQSAGAYLALTAALLWSARRSFAATMPSLARPPAVPVRHTTPAGHAGSAAPSRSDAAGPRTPSSPHLESAAHSGPRQTGVINPPNSDLDGRTWRLPLAGLVAGAAAMLAWCVWTGFPLWFAACYFGFYFATALVLSRIMAESGIPWLLAPILPDKLILSVNGSAVITQQTLARLPLHVQHLRDTRQMLAPAVFQAGRLREEAGVSPGGFYALLLAALGLTLAVGVPVALGMFYNHGALALTTNSDGIMMSAAVIPTTGVNQLSSRLISPLRPSGPAAWAVLAGAAITLALAALRARYLWWPLNPLGYALTGTLQVGYANKMLLSIALGWAFKALTLRFGGAGGFRLLRGLALGLIFGDLLMGGLLKLLDALLGPSGYGIF
ncbi:MAG TPA: DUF6785 family protein, partial [Chthonomonadaceae bacterium]|nr:DUF6785 family protein [Chthonomonadaceae bacterium]